MASNQYEERLIGHCPVDSGSISIADPCYFPEHYPHDVYMIAVDPLMNGVDPAPLRFEKDGIEQGVVMGTGVGDGHFPVYGLFDSSGMLVGAKIMFQGFEPEDDDDPRCENCGMPTDFNGEEYCDDCIEEQLRREDEEEKERYA